MKKLVLLLGVAVLVLAACNSEASEREDYLALSIEYFCWTDEIGDKSAEEMAAEDYQAEAKEIVASHGFDPEDIENMMRLAEKYDQDEEFVADLAEGAKACASPEAIDRLLNPVKLELTPTFVDEDGNEVDLNGDLKVE